MCEKYRSNTKQHIFNHKVSLVEFNEIALDISELDGKYYLTLDYMSMWLQKILIVSKDTIIIKSSKLIFARFGIPQAIIANKNPFNRANFKEFSRSWYFDIMTTSSNYSKSNGFVNKMLKKYQD